MESIENPVFQRRSIELLRGVRGNERTPVHGIGRGFSLHRRGATRRASSQ